MSVPSQHLPTTPQDDFDERLTFLAMLFAAIVMLVGFLTYPPAVLIDPPAVFVFSVTYAALLLLAYRDRPGIYIGISSIVLVAVLLRAGVSAALLMSVIGIILAAVARFFLYNPLGLIKPTLSREILRGSFTAAMAGISIQIGATLVHVLGISLVTGLIIGDMASLLLPISVLFVTIGLIQTTSLVIVLFFGKPLYKRQEKIGIIWRGFLVNTLPLPFGTLLALNYHSLSFVAFVILAGGLVVGAVLYRLSEISRHTHEQRSAELGLIAQFGQTLAQNLPMNDVLDVFYKQIKELIPVDVLAVALYNKASDTVSPVYVRQGEQLIDWPPDRNTNGLFHYVGRSRQPLLVRGNVVQKLLALGIAPIFPPIPECYIGIPLVVGDHLVGMISLEHLTNSKAYGQNELTIIEMLAPQTAIALRNAELYSRLTGMTGELSELNNLTRSISSVLDLDRALNMICQSMITLIRADRTSILLVSEDSRSVSLVASSGLSIDYLTQYQNMPIDSGNVLSGLVDIKQPVVIDDMQTDPRTLGWRSLAESEGFASVAVVPMRTANRALGILTVYYNRPHQISAEDLALLNTMANQVSAAIANARLFREVEQRAEDMSRLVESSYALIESLDIPIIAQILVERLKQLLALDMAAIYMPSREINQLDLLAAAGRPSPPTQLPNTPSLRALSRMLKPISKSTDSSSGFSLNDVEMLREFELQSALALHLTAHAAPIGVAILGSIAARRFTRREWQMAEALLNQAATAIDNATLFHLVDSELEERIRQLLAIENVSRKLTTISSLSTDAVIDEVLKAALSVTYAEVASCGLLRNGGGIRFIIQTRPHVKLLDQSNVIQGITGRVMRTGLPVLSGDVGTDPDYVEVVADVRSELCVPILVRGVAIGVLDLESVRENAFSSAQLSFMTTLADHTALAIEQAGLFTEIQQRNEQMRVILDSTHNGMLLISADMRLIETNSAAERLLNRPLAPYIGKNGLRLLVDLMHDPQIKTGTVSSLLPDPLPDYFHNAFTQAKADPKRELRHFYQIQSEQNTIDVEEFNIPILDEHGHTVARLVVLHDVTHENAIQRFRDQMIDMVVHDLRSPLANVVTSLNIATDLLATADSAAVEQLLDIATQNTYKVIKQVESILELRKMENGQIELALQPTALHALATEAIRTLDATASSAAVSITNHIADTLPIIEMDATQILRVLVNLLDNALKYTPSQGQIRIEAEIMSTEDSSLLVRVVDTGPGIPITMRRQVFDLFVTITNMAIRGRRGMGLGLTFCRLVVEAHGGRIWADGGPEGGAAMCFTLPLTAQQRNGIESGTE